MFNLIPHAGVNDNENAIDSITNAYPLLSLLVFGIMGPVVEEFTYRVGLFSFIRRFNRPAAYIITIAIFALIHFNFQSTNIVNELINLPSYIVAKEVDRDVAMLS